MGSNRIQKLLFSEYSDLEDIVLVEGPFAETDRHGRGIRQIQIGLTPSKLILASYFMEPVAADDLDHQWRSPRCQDLDIESFELVSAYPVESVNLSVYRRHRRQTLKARFCNGKVFYFEIGGWQERKILWPLWCERIKFLSPYESGHSVSETSVGSSSSNSCSSLYIVRSSLSVTQTGTPTLWNHYACAKSSWIDPHLYLGPKFNDKGVNIDSLQDAAGDMTKNRSTCTRKNVTKKRIKYHSNETMILSTQHELLAAEAVETWERRPSGRQPRVRRRYALSPCPYLLGGVGVWRVSKALGYSIQIKKNASLVDLREYAEEFQPPLPKGCLLRTVSLESLEVPATSLEKLLDSKDNFHRPEEVNFWVRYPGELLQWESVQYDALQRYLKATRKKNDPHVFGIRKKKKSNKNINRRKTSENLLSRKKVFSGVEHDYIGGCGDSVTTQILKNNGDDGWLLPVSKFSSSTLAHQLTLVHKQLFLQISTLDLARAREDRNSWRTPSLRTLVFFSYRISCVVANFIILEQDLQRRARVIGKFMSMAYNCHRLQNQMSAEAVLMGLHCPAVYRLQQTWAYVRKHHATNYRRFEDLSRRYFDCREPLYQKTYDDMVLVPPFLPSISLLVAVLMGTIPEPPQVQSFNFATCSESCQGNTTLHMSASATSRTDSNPTPIRKFLSALQILPSPSLTSSLSQHSTCNSRSHVHAASREELLEHLDMFFAPVSDAPSSKALQDMQYFLESHQAAASRYQMPINPKVRAFLLHSRHPDMRTLYKQSLLIEP